MLIEARLKNHDSSQRSIAASSSVCATILLDRGSSSMSLRPRDCKPARAAFYAAARFTLIRTMSSVCCDLSSVLHVLGIFIVILMASETRYAREMRAWMIIHNLVLQTLQMGNMMESSTILQKHKGCVPRGQQEVKLVLRVSSRRSL